MFSLDTTRTRSKHLLTEKQKNANKFQWYKDSVDDLEKYSFYENKFGSIADDGMPTAFKSKKVNYDLYNNILHKADLKYVYQPYGEGVGELPANLTNRDIISPKIKALLGIEMSMPFSWKVVATNPQASTRKEDKETQMLTDFVVSQVMMPIRKEEAIKAQQQVKGKQLTPAEQEQISQQVEQAVQARTPDSVRKYIAREHQDPAEIQGTQILEYLKQKQRLPSKFNEGFKHMLLGGKEVYRLAAINNQPTITVVNALFFDHDQSPEVRYIEDGAWAVAEYRMTPNQILSELGSELTEEQIERLYEYERDPSSIIDPLFSFSENGFTSDLSIRVIHATWKAPMRIGFLTYLDKNNQIQETTVDENYKLNRKIGDLELEWQWIPQSYECYKILDDIYVYPRAVPGQNNDLDTLWEAKLPYYGATLDNMNSIATAPMERVKNWQYYFDIILYRIELLMASDKGKILALNINAIPKSKGYDTKKFLYFMEANHLAVLNPKEEGNRTSGVSGDITNLVKEIDMSLVSQIDFYIKLAEYIETKCGAAIGVNKQMEGAIGPTEAVSNTQQNLIQASYITRPTFELHNEVKANVLQGAIDLAKTTWSENPPETLSYTMDDMTVRMFKVDAALLDASTYGIFVTNSSKAQETKQAIVNLSQAAVQNDKADLLDVANLLDANSIAEAKELLEVAQQKAQERAEGLQKQQMELEKQKMGLEDQRIRDQWAHDKEMVILKEEERRKTEVEKAALTGLSFNPETDQDEDNIPDFLEIAKAGVDAEIKRKNTNINAGKLALEQEKFAHQQGVDKEKLKIENKKLNKPVKT